MNQVTGDQVRRVQKYSAFARALCSLLLVLLALTCVLMVNLLVDTPISESLKFSVGRYEFAASNVEGLPLKLWLFAIITTGLILSCAIIYLLRRVFDNMARGEIFSAGNVQQIRRIGFIILCIGVLQFVTPFVNEMLLANGVIDPGRVSIAPKLQFPGAVSPFAVAGLIFLASWIMRVGLGVSDEAAELRRDAELVV